MTPRGPRVAAPERGSEGYVLFGVVIGLVILGISLTAAVPLWEKIVQREREQELIFRGYQYMQAIQRYQERFPGSFPPNVEILVEQKFLRRAYTDPFAWTEEGEGEFRILRQMSPELQTMLQQGQREAGRAAGITDLNRSRGRTTTPGGSAGGARQPTGGRFQSTLGRTASGGGGGAALGGIVGVASSHDETTFFKVPGKETYRDWLFVYGVATAAPAVRRTSPADARQQSPFPGLPPPPGLTSFRFGPTSGGEGQAVPVPQPAGGPGGNPAGGATGAQTGPAGRAGAPGGVRPPATPPQGR